MNAAGRRVFDLLETEWMTDETRDLAQAGDAFAVRGKITKFPIQLKL